jgi:hypothetical protein
VSALSRPATAGLVSTDLDGHNPAHRIWPCRRPSTTPTSDVRGQCSTPREVAVVWPVVDAEVPEGRVVVAGPVLTVEQTSVVGDAVVEGMLVVVDPVLVEGSVVVVDPVLLVEHTNVVGDDVVGCSPSGTDDEGLEGGRKVVGSGADGGGSPAESGCTDGPCRCCGLTS